MEKEFTSSADVHNEENFMFALKCPVKFDQKGMVQLCQNFTFTKDWLHLVLSSDLIFLQNFDSIQTSSVFLAS